MQMSVIADTIFIQRPIHLIRSGGMYNIGIMRTLKITQPMNCFVSICADSGKWFFMCWYEEKMDERMFWTQSPPVHDCTANQTRDKTMRCTRARYCPYTPQI